MKYEVEWSRPGEPERLRCVDELDVLVERIRSGIENGNGPFLIHSLGPALAAARARRREDAARDERLAGMDDTPPTMRTQGGTDSLSYLCCTGSSVAVLPCCRAKPTVYRPGTTVAS